MVGYYFRAKEIFDILFILQDHNISGSIMPADSYK